MHPGTYQLLGEGGGEYHALVMHVLVLRLPEHGFPFPCGVCARRAAGTTLSAAFLLAEQHKLNPLRDKAVAHIDGRSFSQP